MRFESRPAARIALIGFAAAGLMGVSACGGGFGLHHNASAASKGAPPNAIGVNSYLWRATLDTLAFMPLASADPYGGVIITDWYSAPQNPDERMKLTIYILDRRLRADGIRVAVFRQTRSQSGWADAQVNADTATKLED